MSARARPSESLPPIEASDANGRSVGRREVLIAVKLRRRSESWFASRITQISAGGFRLKSFVKLQPEQAIWIMLPGFDGRRAVVKWVGDHEAGCAFERPLHPAILDHIMRASGPAED